MAGFVTTDTKGLEVIREYTGRVVANGFATGTTKDINNTKSHNLRLAWQREK